MSDDEMVVNDDFGVELDDVGEREWREVDPDAPDPHPDQEVPGMTYG